MILDSGVLSVFRRVDTAPPGHMPDYGHTKLVSGWYGLLSYETAPVSPTSTREDTETSLRVRVYQNQSINNHQIVVLSDVDAITTERQYEIVRAFHGRDDDSGQLITDLTLREVEA